MIYVELTSKDSKLRTRHLKKYIFECDNKDWKNKPIKMILKYA